MSATAAWPLPPHVQLRDFLAADQHRELVDWVLAGESRFTAATVKSTAPASRNRVDPSIRVALVSSDLGALRKRITERLLEALPDLMAAAGAHGPEPRSLELELAAHGDGAHFRPHVDIPLGQAREPLGAKAGEDRVLSAVLYFYREPKAFSGGALRLFRFGADGAEAKADPSNHIDLEPLQNSLVVFPSWASHEVRPVSCPSRRFADHRFALNCWYCRPLQRP